MTGACGCGNEPFGSIKCGELLDQLRTSYIPRKDRAPLSRLVIYRLGYSLTEKKANTN